MRLVGTYFYNNSNFSGCGRDRGLLRPTTRESRIGLSQRLGIRSYENFLSRRTPSNHVRPSAMCWGLGRCTALPYEPIRLPPLERRLPARARHTFEQNVAPVPV